ncbi:centrin [Pavlovales sp. CCMP2436]|nr:centrin [Pavlovales sp. CCMP2436]
MVRALDTGRYHRQKRELRDTQLSEIRDSFELFDQDGAGTVQAKDLKRFLANVDGANTGQLDFDNYLQIVLDKLGEKPTVEEVSKAFRLFAEGDNESGRISFDRLKQIAEEIGETIADEELREMISEADQSGTGTVSNDDFLRIITSRHRTT